MRKYIDNNIESVDMSWSGVKRMFYGSNCGQTDMMIYEVYDHKNCRFMVFKSLKELADFIRYCKELQSKPANLIFPNPEN